MKVRWLGNYSFVLEASDKIIVVDPQAGVEDDYPIADVVIITQFHVAHCNLGLVRNCIGDKTSVLGTPEVASNLYPCGEFRAGDRRVFDDIEIFCTPASNDRPALKPEQAVRDRIGFVLHAEGRKFFFIGDSDFVEGMQSILPDVLFVPVGGTLTLDSRAAFDVTRLIAPKLAVPVHWGGFVGSRDDAEYFADLCGEKNINVRVVMPGEVFEV